jgi:hypothetical protein
MNRSPLCPEVLRTWKWGQSLEMGTVTISRTAAQHAMEMGTVTIL